MITVPTSLARQLAVPLCRLTHGCSFLTVGDLFGVPNSLVDLVNLQSSFVSKLQCFVMNMYFFQEMKKSARLKYTVLLRTTNFHARLGEMNLICMSVQGSRSAIPGPIQHLSDSIKETVCYVVILLVDFHVYFGLLLSKRAHFKGSSEKKGASTESFQGGQTPPLQPPPITRST